MQSAQSYFWKIDRVNREMKNILLEAFEMVWKLSKERKVSLRNAAYMIAIDRVAKTHENFLLISMIGNPCNSILMSSSSLGIFPKIGRL
ncbi:MAG: hypothetical protein ACTSR5_11985 [Promethearchaeota archaeon]